MGAEASLTMYGNTSVSKLHGVAIIIILYTLGIETSLWGNHENYLRSLS